MAILLLAREMKIEYKKDFNCLVRDGLASILVFGTFIADKKWKEEERGKGAN